MKFWRSLPGPFPVKAGIVLGLIGLVLWFAKNPAAAGQEVSVFFTKGLPAVADWLSKFFSHATGSKN